MKEIKEFLLPEHTNRLYQEEAISSISLTKAVAEKINELVRAYNTAFSDNLTKQQEQDGKIRKAVVYMKDNLLNSLHDLMVLLMDSGFIDDRIEYHCDYLKNRVDTLLTKDVVDGELIDSRVDFKGETDTTLGNGLRRQFKELFGQMINENLFKLKNITFGYLQNDGTITAKQGDYSGEVDTAAKRFELTSDFISVDVDTNYHLKIHNIESITDEPWFRIISYDENKNVIASVDRTYKEFSFTTGDNTKYVRISYRSYLTGIVKFEKSTYATPLIEGFKNEIESLEDFIFPGFVESVKGTLARPQAFNEKMTNAIKTEPGEIFNLFSWGVYDSWYRITYYSSDYKVVKEESLYFNNLVNKECVTPEGASFIRISIRSLDMRFFAFIKNTNKAYQMYKELFTGCRMNKPLMNSPLRSIAHRGLSTEAPENTLPAFKLAVERGFKYLECDVVMTSDGIPVLHHDDTIDRTSDKTGNVRDFTYNELYSMDFGYKNLFGDMFKGTKIMKLDEFITFCRNASIHPYIELKSGIDGEGIAKIVDIVKSYGMINNCTFISFSKTELLNVLENCPYARIGYVYDTITGEVVENALNLITPFNEVFFDTNYINLTDDVVSMCKAINIPIEVYTVNSESDILNLNPYVNGVTSDCFIANDIYLNETGV